MLHNFRVGTLSNPSVGVLRRLHRTHPRTKLGLVFIERPLDPVTLSDIHEVGIAKSALEIGAERRQAPSKDTA